MTLEIPQDLETRLRPLADQQGETLETFALTHLEKLTRDTIDTNGTTETREQRRARIQAAIAEAQSHFAPMLHGGDAVSQLMNEKRADAERAMERGL